MPQNMPNTPTTQWSRLSDKDWQEFAPQVAAAIEGLLKILDQAEKRSGSESTFDLPVHRRLQRRAS